jgi:RimJ/RimL family protein N-acetyltransferase
LKSEFEALKSAIRNSAIVTAMPEPVIETARLRLRPFAAADAADLHRHWTQPPVRKYLWDDRVISREEAADVVRMSADLFRRHGFGFWCVRDKGDGALAGYCGFRFMDDTDEIEIGYAVEPARWGEGLATEAARACLRYGFEEAHFPRVLGITDSANAASARVLEKLGMAFERRAPHHGLDTLFYALARADFRPGDSPYRLLRD